MVYHFNISNVSLFEPFTLLFTLPQLQGQSIDFIKRNARAAAHTTLRRSQSLTNLGDKPVPSAVKGQVPQ